LEAFDPNRTFPLAYTQGKLANIVSEMGEVQKAAEGILKKFVSGEALTVEKKHRDPFQLIPTARLTFSTNVLPRFVDRSDGLWRRLVVVEWGNQILDENKQDKNLINPKWWRESGELAGVFNWALEGLKRLRERGHFVEPEHCRTSKDRFKKDSNPARSFLEENCENSPSDAVAVSELYKEYSVYARESGFRPLAQTMFSKEVRRTFPDIAQTDHPQRLQDGTRSHLWQGLKLLIVRDPSDWRGR